METCQEESGEAGGPRGPQRRLAARGDAPKPDFWEEGLLKTLRLTDSICTGAALGAPGAQGAGRGLGVAAQLRDLSL